MTRGSPGAIRSERRARIRRARRRARRPTSSASRATRRAALGVVRSELEHRAEHRDALRPAPGVAQQLDRRARRARVRVVRVVDQRQPRRAARGSTASAATASPRFRAPRPRRRRRTRAPRRWRASRFAGCAHPRSGTTTSTPSTVSVSSPVGVDRRVAAGDVACVEPCRRHDARARARAAATTSGCDAGTIATGTPSVAAISSRITPARSPSPSRCSSAIDVTTVMFGSTIARSRGDLAGLVRPHLDDGDVRGVGNREQRERNADEVVQIAARRVHLEHASQRGA